MVPFSLNSPSTPPAYTPYADGALTGGNTYNLSSTYSGVQFIGGVSSPNYFLYNQLVSGLQILQSGTYELTVSGTAQYSVDAGPFVPDTASLNIQKVHNGTGVPIAEMFIYGFAEDTPPGTYFITETTAYSIGMLLPGDTIGLKVAIASAPSVMTQGNYTDGMIVLKKL
jgi:hypothetical protein